MTQKERSPQQEFFIRCYYIFLCYLVGGELVTKPILQITHSLLNVPGKLDTLVLYAVIAFLGAAGFYGKILFGSFRFRIPELLLFGGLLSVFLIGFVRSGDYTDVFSAMFRQFALGMVMYLFFRYCDDKKRLLDDLAILSVFMTAAMFLLLWLSGGEELFDRSYSQYYAYLILPAFVISMNETMRKKSIFYGAVALTCFILTFLMGARGPIVIELVFFAVRLVAEPIRPIGKIAVFSFTAGAAALLYFNLYSVLSFLNSLAVRANLSSRIFEKLLNGALYESGRSGVYGAALQLLSEHPFFGVGIGTDRIEIAKLLGQSDALGTYPHLFFLELPVQFGLIAGGLLAVGFVILGIRARLRAEKDTCGVDVFRVMLMICFAPLLFSSSYFTYPLFFAMLALWQSDFESPQGRKDLLQ